VNWRRFLADQRQPINFLAETIKFAEGLASTSRASQRVILPVLSRKEDAMFKKAFTAIALTVALAAYAPTAPAIAKTVVPMAQGGGLAGADAALGAPPSGYSSWGAITDPAAAFAAQPSAYVVSGKQQKQPKSAHQRPSDQSK
jgi:hypothetical protein